MKPVRAWKPWTEAEMKILVEINAMEGPLSQRIDRLPGRTYRAIKAQVQSMGLSKERVSICVLDLLADGVARTSKQVSELVNRPEKSVASVLLRLSVPGNSQMIHVADTNGAARSRRYVIGKGQNACIVKAWTRKISIRAAESAEDDAYRTKATWWPHGDPVVVDAMRAMMFVGRTPV